MNGVNFSVTALAMDKVREFMQIRQPTPLGIRILVYSDERGNVCHSMSFVYGVESSDVIFNISEITFVTDASSSFFLNNVTLDFMELGGAQGFTFKRDCVSKNCFSCNGSCGARQFN